MDDNVPDCRLTRSVGAVQLARAGVYSRLRAKTGPDDIGPTL